MVGGRSIHSMSRHSTLTVLYQQIQDVWNNVSRDGIRHVYQSMHLTVQVYVNAQGGYTEEDICMCDCAYNAVLRPILGIQWISHTPGICLKLVLKKANSSKRIFIAKGYAV